MHKTVLVRCTARAAQLHTKVLGLNNKLRDRALFSFERTDEHGVSQMNRGGAARERARREVLERFYGRYPSLCGRDLENVRVWVAFAAVPNEEVAREMPGVISKQLLCSPTPARKQRV